MTPYSILEWDRMDHLMGYTAISSATSKDLIHIVPQWQLSLTPTL